LNGFTHKVGMFAVLVSFCSSLPGSNSLPQALSLVSYFLVQHQAKEMANGAIYIEVWEYTALDVKYLGLIGLDVKNLKQTGDGNMYSS